MQKILLIQDVQIASGTLKDFGPSKPWDMPYVSCFVEKNCLRSQTAEASFDSAKTDISSNFKSLRYPASRWSGEIGIKAGIHDSSSQKKKPHLSVVRNGVSIVRHRKPFRKCVYGFSPSRGPALFCVSQMEKVTKE
jgi:hypothetical protein